MIGAEILRCPEQFGWTDELALKFYSNSPNYGFHLTSNHSVSA